MLDNSKDKTKQQLLAENEVLKASLDDYENTLNAIRNGEVDAIVVSGTKGEQVFSIASAVTPYRQFIEDMNEGAVTLTREGLILYCNPKFAEMVGEPLEHVIGSDLERFISTADKAKINRVLAQKTHKKNHFLIISLINSIFLKLSFHLLPPYLEGDHFIITATDITELKQHEKELLRLHRILENQFDQLKGLRIDLINAEIMVSEENNKLKNANKKLTSQIARHKKLVQEIKHKSRKAGI